MLVKVMLCMALIGLLCDGTEERCLKRVRERRRNRDASRDWAFQMAVWKKEG